MQVYTWDLALSLVPFVKVWIWIWKRYDYLAPSEFLLKNRFYFSLLSKKNMYLQNFGLLFKQCYNKTCKKLHGKLVW